MTVNSLKKYFSHALKGLYPETEIHSFFYLLANKFMHKTRLELALDTAYEVSLEVENIFIGAIKKLKNNEPIQYILGETFFLDLPFKVTADVLIPRPETEELVQWILKEQKQDKKVTVLDIGTGSGCIAISLANKLKEATVYGLDVSKEALKIASDNAKMNQTSVTFLHADIREEISQLKTIIPNIKFDIIVSNPPYVLEKEKSLMQDNVLKYEPAIALFVSDDDPLYFYKKIAIFSNYFLKDNGKLFFEINEGYAQETVALLKAYNFFEIKIGKDIYGKERMIKANFYKEI